MNKKFLAVISDMDGNPDYLHPSEIYGTSKKEIHSLLLENVPSDNIVGIYTEDEYQQFVKTPKFKAAVTGFDDQNLNGNDFFNRMINVATFLGEELDNQEIQEQQQIKQQPVQQPIIENTTPIVESKPVETEIQQPQLNTVQDSITYFTDNGINFKVENGKIYKKTWHTIKPKHAENSTEIIFDDFRIINRSTGKPIKNTKYDIQVLDWVLLESQQDN